MPEVIDNTRQHRFEMEVDGHVAHVDYALDGNQITLIHTEVPDALGGRGIGSKLAAAVLNTIRARGQTVVPQCSFIAQYINKHPEFADMVG
jgi:uncharacterized protein